MLIWIWDPRVWLSVGFCAMFSRGLYSVPQYLWSWTQEETKVQFATSWKDLKFAHMLCSSKQTHLFLLSLCTVLRKSRAIKLSMTETSVKWYKLAYPSPCVVGNCEDHWHPDCIFQSRNHNEVSWGVKLYYPTNERTKDYYPRNPYLLITNLTYTDPLQNWSRQIYVGGSLLIFQVPQRHELQYHTADDHLCWRVHHNNYVMSLSRLMNQIDNHRRWQWNVMQFANVSNHQPFKKMIRFCTRFMSWWLQYNGLQSGPWGHPI